MVKRLTSRTQSPAGTTAFMVPDVESVLNSTSDRQKIRFQSDGTRIEDAGSP